MQLDDIYVGVEPSRRKKVIQFFFDNYLIGFQEILDYYEYPQFGGSIEFETEDLEEMLSFVLKKNKGFYHFYFNNDENKEYQQAMIFINEDGSVFLGLAAHPAFSSKYVETLKRDFNSSLIVICNEVLPPNNLQDFAKIALAG